MPAGATYEPIATYTVGSNVASYSVTSIPGTYTDLKVVINARSTLSPSQDSLWSITFNSDSGSNYSSTLIRGTGYAASSLSQTNVTAARIGWALTVGAGSNMYSSIILDCFNYAGSTNKTFLSTNTADFGNAGNVSRIVGLWRSTSAITSFTITDNNAANIAIGTTITLYGIARA
jgi:hypothetical protein